MEQSPPDPSESWELSSSVSWIEEAGPQDAKSAKFFWFWETTHRHLGMFISVETWDRPCQHSAGAVVLRKLTVTHRHLAHWCAVDLRVNVLFSQWEKMGWDSAQKRRQKWSKNLEERSKTSSWGEWLKVWRKELLPGTAWHGIRAESPFSHWFSDKIWSGPTGRADASRNRWIIGSVCMPAAVTARHYTSMTNASPLCLN